MDVGARRKVKPGRGAGGNVDAPLYWAAERTLLAWVRTGIALMLFGFVVARYSFSRAAEESMKSGSTFAGVALLALGATVCGVAGARYLRTIRSLEAGDRAPDPRTPALVAIGASALAAIIITVLLASALR